MFRELWKPVSEWPYEVSNVGRVRSKDRIILCSNGNKRPMIGKVLKANTYLPYYTVLLKKSGNKPTRVYIHVLVALAFIGKKPPGFCVNHKDHNKRNNLVSNLEWVSYSDNLNHGLTGPRGITRFGEGHSGSKLTNKTCTAIIKGLESGVKSRHLAKIFGVSESIISRIKHGKNWKHMKRGVYVVKS